MAKLSISNAWDETQAFATRELRLLAPLALALLFLPGVLVALFAPPGSTSIAKAPPSYIVLFFAEGLIGLVAQLAIARLALGHRERVGDTLGHALRRLPAYLGALLIFALPASIALGALLAVAQTAQRSANQPLALVALLGLTILMVAALIFVARTMLNVAIASSEGGGPLVIFKRGLALTRGAVLRLLGATLLFVIGGALASFALVAAVGAVVTLLAGQPEPLSISALLIAATRAATQTVLVTLFTIFLARIYAQRVLMAGVPSSGT